MSNVLLLVQLWAQHGRGEALTRYEDAVLALLPEHGGRLLERVVPIDPEENSAAETQLIEFDDEAGYLHYLNDPRRTARSAERDAAVRRTELVPVRR